MALSKVRSLYLLPDAATCPIVFLYAYDKILMHSLAPSTTIIYTTIMNHCIENPEIRNLLDRICQTIVDHGGYIDPQLTIRYEKDQFTMHQSGEVSGEHLIKIPHDLLIPYHSVDLDVEGGKIIIADYDDSRTQAQKKIFEDVIALYNTTPIFENHYNNNPWLNYEKHHQIVALLLRGRSGKDLSVIRTMLSDRDYKDELALFTFFKKRIIHTRINSRSGAITEVVLPLIEFLRHHPAGAPYENLYGEDIIGGQMAVRPAMPVPDSDECYTSYGHIDALEAYLHYGFVTQNVSFVRSVPLHIKVEGLGSFAVNANNIPLPAQDVPAHLQGLGHYLPQIKYFEQKNAVRLSHLIIPRANAPVSLKRVLREAIIAFGRDLDEAEIKAYIADGEQQLIEQNLAFYSELASLTAFSSASSPLVQDLERIIACQRHIIEFYQTNLM